MIYGHGDDTASYPGVSINFSSNVYAHFNHEGLFACLARCLPRIGHYPPPAPLALEEAIAQRLGLDASQVMVTSGATEAIYLIAQAFARCTSAVLSPTFSEYADACALHGHSVSLVHSLAPEGAQTMWLCAPNNPTGQLLPLSDIAEAIARHPRTTFILDASYAHYTTLPTLSPSQGCAFPNLLMLHSMTKRFGVPGLRLGYVTAPAPLLDRIRPLRMPWSVGLLAQEAGLYLLAHEDDYSLPALMLNEERRRLALQIEDTAGITTLPSDCHILLCRLAQGNASLLKQRLALSHGILIRDASNFPGLTPQHFRLAVQQPADNRRLLLALPQCLPC